MHLPKRKAPVKRLELAPLDEEEWGIMYSEKWYRGQDKALFEKNFDKRVEAYQIIHSASTSVLEIRELQRLATKFVKDEKERAKSPYGLGEWFKEKNKRLEELITRFDEIQEYLQFLQKLIAGLDYTSVTIDEQMKDTWNKLEKLNELLDSIEYEVIAKGEMETLPKQTLARRKTKKIARKEILKAESKFDVVFPEFEPKSQATKTIQTSTSKMIHPLLRFVAKRYPNVCVVRRIQTYDIVAFQMELAWVLQGDMEKCMQQKNIDFIVIPLVLLEGKDPQVPAHANILIYDAKTKQVELFEPHIISPYGEALSKKTYKHIEAILKNTDPEIVLLRPVDYCPRTLGLQSIEAKALYYKSEPGGYCVSWSLWWVIFKLENPQVSRNVLMDKALEKFQDPYEARGYIRNFARFLQELYEESTKTRVKTRIEQIGTKRPVSEECASIESFIDPTRILLQRLDKWYKTFKPAPSATAEEKLNYLRFIPKQTTQSQFTLDVRKELYNLEITLKNIASPGFFDNADLISNTMEEARRTHEMYRYWWNKTPIHTTRKTAENFRTFRYVMNDLIDFYAVVYHCLFPYAKD